jgi:excisionase family DNA binding protein
MRLTPEQAAKKAGVSRNLVYRWCEEKRLPHYRLGGQGRRGRIMIDEGDLEAFLDSCKIRPDGDGAEGPDDEWP